MNVKTVKKALSLLLVFLMCLGSMVAAPAFAEETDNAEVKATVTLTADKTEVNPGDVVNLTLSIDNQTAFITAKFFIAYNGDQVEYVDKSAKSPITTACGKALHEDQLTMAYAGIEPQTVADGVILTASFKVKDGVTGPIEFTQDTGILRTLDTNDKYVVIPHKFVNEANLVSKLPAGDKTELNALLVTAKAYKAENYTAESFAVLNQAITAAEALPADAPQADIDASKNTLQAAINQLAALADKTALNTALSDAKAKLDNANAYSAETVQALQTAYDAALAVQAEEVLKADQKRVDDVTTALRAAVDGLKEKGIIAVSLSTKPSCEGRTYLIGKTFNRVEGGKITVTYDDAESTTAELALTEDMCSNADMAIAGEKTIEVAYKGIKAPETFSFTMIEKPVLPAEDQLGLNRISEDQTVKVFSDKDVLAEDESIKLVVSEPSDTAEALINGDAGVSRTFGSKFTVLSLKDIKLLEQDNPIEGKAVFIGFKLPDDFDTANVANLGIVHVRADQTVEVLPTIIIDGYAYAETDAMSDFALVLGEAPVTTTDVVRNIAGITVSKLPQTEYTVGDAFSVKDGEITVSYDYGADTDVVLMTAEGVECTGYDMGKIGEQTVTVTYEGQTAEYAINVKEKAPEPTVEPEPSAPAADPSTTPQSGGTGTSGGTGSGQANSGNAGTGITGQNSFSTLGAAMALIAAAGLIALAGVRISKRKSK